MKAPNWEFGEYDKKFDETDAAQHGPLPCDVCQMRKFCIMKCATKDSN